MLKFLLALALAMTTPASASAATPTPTALPDQTTEAIFGRAPAAGEWVAGDGSSPVRLPDGRVAWLFGDSLIRRADGGDAFVNNTIVIQRGSSLRTLRGGNVDAPRSLIAPILAGSWLWPSSGFVENGRLNVFVEEFTRPAGGGFQATNRRYLVRVNPDASSAGVLSGLRQVYPGRISWGHTTLRSGQYVYVYGNLEVDGWTNHTYLARFLVGSSRSPWQFWAGAGWVLDPHLAMPLLHTDGRPIPKVAGVAPIVGTLAAFTIMPFGSSIDLRRSVTGRPEGPFQPAEVLYQLPEPLEDPPRWPYLPRALRATDRHLLVAYSVPDSRPRYLTVTW